MQIPNLFELSKVVIEDMDVKVRNKPPFAVTWEPPGGDFDRAFTSCDDCVSALIKSGYDEKRVKVRRGAGGEERRDDARLKVLTS